MSAAAEIVTQSRHFNSVERTLVPTDFWNPVPSANKSSDIEGNSGHDFWQPLAGVVPALQAGSQDSPQPLAEAFDYWSPVSDSEAVEAPSSDWSNTSALPWFDPTLTENPYTFSTERPSAQTLAERRGRWLAQLLEVPEQRRRIRYATTFAELFEQFPSQPTFRALIDLALAGVEPDTLVNGCMFRCSFLDTRRLHARRSAKQFASYTSSEPESVLSWRRAVRLAQLCGGNDPTDYIDESWYFDWLELSFGNELYWVYLDYIEWRLKAMSHDYLDPHCVVRSKNSALETLRNIGEGRILSQSRTGELIRGPADHVGVLYAQPVSPNMTLRRAFGKTYADRKLLDKAQT
jgi:hypothetical protein